MHSRFSSACRHGAVRAVVAVLCGLAFVRYASPVQAQAPARPPGEGPQEATDGAEARGFRPSFGGSLTIASAFVWRGFVLGADPALQPSVWAEIGPFTVTSWSNTYVPSPGHVRYSEHDLTVDYAREVHGTTVSFGWTNYAYPHETTGRYSNEFYAALAGGGYLTPKLQVYHDVNEGDGTYVMLAVSHEYAVRSNITLTPLVSLGYNHHQWTDRVGFSDVTAVVTGSFPTPVPHLALQPFFGYSCGLEVTIFPRRFYGGVTLAVTRD